jgi:hypothetical protein
MITRDSKPDYRQAIMEIGLAARAISLKLQQIHPGAVTGELLALVEDKLRLARQHLGDE